MSGPQGPRVAGDGVINFTALVPTASSGPDLFPTDTFEVHGHPLPFRRFAARSMGEFPAPKRALQTYRLMDAEPQKVFDFSPDYNEMCTHFMILEELERLKRQVYSDGTNVVMLRRKSRATGVREQQVSAIKYPPGYDQTLYLHHAKTVVSVSQRLREARERLAEKSRQCSRYMELVQAYARAAPFILDPRFIELVLDRESFIFLSPELGMMERGDLPAVHVILDGKALPLSSNVQLPSIGQTMDVSRRLLMRRMFTALWAEAEAQDGIYGMAVVEERGAAAGVEAAVVGAVPMARSDGGPEGAGFTTAGEQEAPGVPAGQGAHEGGEEGEAGGAGEAREGQAGYAGAPLSPLSAPPGALPPFSGIPAPAFQAGPAGLGGPSNPGSLAPEKYVRIHSTLNPLYFMEVRLHENPSSTGTAAAKGSGAPQRDQPEPFTEKAAASPPAGPSDPSGPQERPLSTANFRPGASAEKLKASVIIPAGLELSAADLAFLSPQAVPESSSGSEDNGPLVAGTVSGAVSNDGEPQSVGGVSASGQNQRLTSGAGETPEGNSPCGADLLSGRPDRPSHPFQVPQPSQPSQSSQPSQLPATGFSVVPEDYPTVSITFSPQSPFLTGEIVSKILAVAFLEGKNLHGEAALLLDVDLSLQSRRGTGGRLQLYSTPLEYVCLASGIPEQGSPGEAAALDSLPLDLHGPDE